MTGLALLALLAAAHTANASEGSMHKKFLEDRVAEMKAQGFTVKRSAVGASSDRGKLAAYVFSSKAVGEDKLIVWHLKGRSAGKIYIEPTSAVQIELERIHQKNRFPDLYADGSRSLAYRVTGGGSSALRVVRFVGNRAQPEPAPLHDGFVSDLDGDGSLEIVSRSLPLGRLYSIDCGDFHSRAGQNAWKTVVYGAQEGKLVDVSARHAAFYNDHIARLEGDLASMDPRATKRYGEFMGAALAIYFDHAQKGLPRQGWARFTELFRAGEGDPSGTADCINRVKEDVRNRLGVPAGWNL